MCRTSSPKHQVRGAFQCLERDHDLVRRKVALVEAAASLGAEGWVVLREAVFTLGQYLQSHSQQEMTMLELRHDDFTMPDEHVLSTTIGHRDKLQSLRVLNRACMEEPSPSGRSEVCRALKAFAEGLSDELALQEEELFPELHLSDSNAPEEGHHQIPTLRPDITLGVLIQQHPKAKPVVERLGIASAFEGYDRLDEIAWRHGMDCEELIAQLSPIFHE